MVIEFEQTKQKSRASEFKALGKAIKEKTKYEKQNLTKLKYIEGQKKKKNKEFNKITKKLGSIVKIAPKKFLLERKQATIILPKQSETKPILSSHSNYFKSEYEKEKALLGWK